MPGQLCTQHSRLCRMHPPARPLPPLQGFDEYMNVVLDEAEEVSVKRNSRKPLGRIMLKVGRAAGRRGGRAAFRALMDILAAIAAAAAGPWTCGLNVGAQGWA